MSGCPGSEYQNFQKYVPKANAPGPHNLVITVGCKSGAQHGPCTPQARKAKTLPPNCSEAVWPFSRRRIILPGRKKHCSATPPFPHFRSGPPLWPAFFTFCPCLSYVPVWSVSCVTCRQLPLNLFAHSSSLLDTTRHIPLPCGCWIYNLPSHTSHTTYHRPALALCATCPCQDPVHIHPYHLLGTDS